MKVLVINAGSSSLKYQLIEMSDESVLAKGNCERIGVDGHIGHKTAAGVKVEYDASFPSHKEAFMELVKVLTTGEGKVIDDMKEIAAIGHRVLHGGEIYKVSSVVDEKLISTVEELSELSGRFRYELVCGIGARVPRVYTEKGRIVAYSDQNYPWM